MMHDLGNTYRRRMGVTLLELIVVFAVMAVATGVATVSFRPPQIPLASDSVSAQVHELRTRAVRAGRPATATIQTDSGTRAVTAYPDSRVNSELTTLVDYLTGRRHGEK